MNRFLRSQYPPNPRDLAVFDTTTGSSQGRTRGVGRLNKLWMLLSVSVFMFLSLGSNAQTILSESFDGATFVPTGWTNLLTSGTNTWTRVTAGTFPTQTPHSGAGEAKFNSYSANGGVRSLVTPSLNFSTTTGLKRVSFWMYRDNGYLSTADRVDVLVNTAPVIAGAVSLGTINRAINLTPTVAANGWYQYTFDIPGAYSGATNFVIFRATSAYGNNIYVDDILVENVNVCAGTPAPGNTLASSNPVCAGTSFNLTLQNATTGTGVTYQWYSSADGVNYSPVATGGTSATLSTSITAATSYYCAVTCSGNTGNSTPVNVTLNSFLNCYCSSISAYTGDEEITNVAIGTLSNASTCATLAPGPGSIVQRYANYKSGAGIPAAPDFIRGASAAGTVTIGSCGTTNYTSGLAIFIDLNQDGDYLDAGEKVYSNGAAIDINCVPATVKAVSLAIPATATLGLTTMRIINAESYSGDAITGCFAYGYGETEDYMVNIVSPPPPPTITSLSAVGGCAGQGSVIITGDNFAGVTSVSFASAPAAGNLVVNLAPTATNGGYIDEVSWTLTNNLGVVIGSGGPYGTAPVSVAIGNAANGPYSLFIETQGTFNDNEVIYDVTCNGTSVLSGIQTPNTTQTYSVAACNGAPGAGVNATYTVNSTTQITANIPASAVNGAITVTTAAGSASSVSFNVYAIPTTTVTGGATICSAGGSPSNVSSATLSASGSGSVAWTPSTGLSAATGASVTASPSATTTYTATLTDANGCVTSGTTTVTVSQTPGAIAVTPANPTVCAGSTVTLSVATPADPGFVSYSFGTNLSSNGPAFTAGTATVAIPTGATITSASLVFTNVAAVNGSWLSEIRAALSGAITLPATGISTTNGGGTLATYSLALSTASISSGVVTLTLSESYDDFGVLDATFGNIELVINYSVPPITYTWYDSFAQNAGTGSSITTPTLYYNEYYAVEAVQNGCTSLQTFIPILVEEVSGIVLTPVNVSCNGLNNGSFTQTQTCGTAPFSYVIVPTGGVNTGAYTPGIPTNLAPGTYDVYLQDANLFTNSVPVALTITEPAALPVVLEPTGASICAGVNEGNISALSGILIPGTATYSMGTNINSYGPAFTAGTSNVSIPAGSTITGASLVFTNVAAINGSYLSEIRVSLSGAVTLAPTQISTQLGGTIASYTLAIPTANLASIANGTATLTLSETYNDGGDATLDATFGEVQLVINYLEPSGAVLWYSAASGGTLLGAGNTLDLVGTSICPEPAVAGTYTAYAFSTDGTCLSAGTPVTLTVGTPMAVAIDGMPGSNANCTYSIGLSDSFGDGWNGNTATVLVNGTAVLSGITLAAGAGPQYYNFTVSAGQTISVVYTPAGGLSWPEENSYVVFDGADGAGAAVYTATAQAGGPTTPASVTNNCGSSTVCPGTEVTLTANVTGGGQPYTYAWSTGETTPSITVAASSTPVGLTVTDACGTVVAATDAVFSLYSIPTPAISGYNGIPVNDVANAFQTGAVAPFTSGAYNGGQWNVTGIDPGTTFQWTVGNSATGPFTNIAGATANPQTLIATGGAGTVYLQATVTTTQGCATSTPAFQVALSNIYDTPCTAGNISLGDQNGFVYSNAAATVDAGEPAAPAGGCNTQTTWCNATLNNTVWFSFVAPASGHVSINGAGFDSQFAVYSATNCADYSTFTLIAANDDANGLAAGLTDLQCLNPGATYFLQVDGYGAPGVFTITVTDLGNTAPAIYNTPANQTVDAGTVPPMTGSVTASLGSASIGAGGTQTLSGVIPALPAGATITSTEIVVNGVTATGGTWVSDMTVAASGAVSLSAVTLNGAGGVTNGGPYSQTTSNPTLAGGAVDVTFVNTWTFGGSFTANTVNVVVNYTTPAANSNTCDAIVLWTAPYITDDQPNGLVVTQSHNSGDTFPVGTTTVTYTATDCAGQVATTSFTVTVVDVTAPVATADADVTVDAAVGACSATVSLTQPTASDNCGVATITNDAPATFPIGTTVVTWTVTDVNSNVTTVTQNVTVNVNAGSVEVCDNADNDCDSQIDEGLTFVDYYADADGDSYGAGTAVSACSQPAGYVTNNTDCNDSNNAIYPGATEVCNSTDDNCDSQIDEGLTFTNYYVDTDGDGYGAGTAVSACSQPAGYVTSNTDCNNAVASVNPGASEVCGNNYDDNCNGTVNEGCATNLPGENPSNAISMATSTWPNCFSNVNSTLAGMAASSASQTTCLTGEDKWYQFVATTEGVSILVNSTQNDILIELQTAAGTLVAQENAVAGLGNEILNYYGLTAGQVYKVGIRNYDSSLGIGTFSACVRMLKRGGCDYGPGPYSLCQYFKATWAGASGTSYRFTFTGTSGAANGNVYTRTQSTDICVLSNVTPTMPYGSSYNVLITNIYTLQDGAGNNEVLEVPALAPCTLNTIAEPVSQLRASDNCSAGPRFRSAVVASLPWSCGAINWRWEFVEVDGSNNPVGLPIYHLRNAASNYLNLGTVAALQYGKTYRVRTCPIFTYTGTNYNWGPVQYMCIIGQSGMIAEGANAQAGDDVKVSQDLSQNLNVYPNPTNGSDINIQLSNITSENVQVRVLDAMGRVVFANRYAVDGMFTTNMTFDRPLANGLYMIEASFNGEVLTQRMMVQK